MEKRALIRYCRNVKIITWYYEQQVPINLKIRQINHVFKNLFKLIENIQTKSTWEAQNKQMACWFLFLLADVRLFLREGSEFFSGLQVFLFSFPKRMSKNIVPLCWFQNEQKRAKKIWLFFVVCVSRSKEKNFPHLWITLLSHYLLLTVIYLKYT